MSEKEFTHIDSSNNPSMVDVSNKIVTQREATAQSNILLTEEIVAQFKDGEITSKKGPVLQTAIIAGTMAAKKTADLIPFCHPLAIEKCTFKTDLNGLLLSIFCTVKVSGKTGVEMEALVGASTAALTVYDMCKALSHDLVIQETKLVSKTGGKSDFQTK
uniref:cyclic pyranopterin monophosphate synthase MoaC n=1 Tax=Fulvivirga sp. TaxID=1931237 RepID=UPI0040492BDC